MLVRGWEGDWTLDDDAANKIRGEVDDEEHLLKQILKVDETGKMPEGTFTHKAEKSTPSFIKGT